MTLTVYLGPLSMFSTKIEIALAEKGLAAAVEPVPFTIRDLYQPKHPEVVRINPKAQVPVLIDGAVELYDSTVIFEYLEDVAPEPPLWPGSPADRARARRLELESDEAFFPHVSALIRQAQSTTPDPQAITEARAALARFYAAAELRVGDQPWLAGAAPSYADVAFYAASLFAGFLGEPIPSSAPRLRAWADRARARPAFAAATERVVRTWNELVRRPSA